MRYEVDAILSRFVHLKIEVTEYVVKLLKSLLLLLMSVRIYHVHQDQIIS